MIFLVGGGFAGKFDDCTQEVCKGMVQKGYVVVAADYRVGFKNALLAGQCIGDFNSGMYPAYVRAIQDSRSLIRYLKANAERLGIDPNLIFISGQSAGALAAIGTALMDNNNAPKEVMSQVGGSLDPMNDNMQYDTKVAGVISMAGATNYWICIPAVLSVVQTGKHFPLYMVVPLFMRHPERKTIPYT